VAAFTLIARWLGYPARIAVGYLAPAPDHGIYTVTGADARAWSEAYFTGYGWVPFDPTYPIANRARKAPSLPKGPSSAAGGAPAALPSASPSPLPPAQVGAVQPVRRIGVVPQSRWLAWLTAAAAFLVAVAGLGLVAVWLRIAATKSRLRGRRKAGTASQRVAGAWLEAMDRLTELGAEFTVTTTAGEVVREARLLQLAAGEPVDAILRVLSVAQTQAVFGPGNCGESVARQAWLEEHQLVRALYPRRLSWQRLRALRDPRPLHAAGGPARNEVSA
jgi:Transglutaminase-like superfamily